MNDKTLTLCECTKETDDEKFSRLCELVEEYKVKEGCLIPVLSVAQAIYGYLPENVLGYIAKELDKPLSEVYGVVTFYSFFSTVPKGRYSIKVCMGTACYVRGGKKILEKLKKMLKIDVGETTEDGRFTLEVMRCMGACGLAPAMTINGKVYKQVNPDKLESLISKYYAEEGYHD